MDISLSTLQDDYIHEYLTALDCPRSLTAWLLYAHKEHEQLARLEFDPLCYNNIVDARDSLASTKFLSKAAFLSTNIDLKEAALDKFRSAEEVCLQTNLRIRSHRFKNPLTESCLLGMARKISFILGSFDADEFVDSCSWGPGATTAIKRVDALAPEKYRIESCITRDAYDFVSPWFHAAYPSWDVHFVIENCNKVVTVPKDAKSDRTIAIEPGINLWFQKGIGSMMRRRLKRTGIDLDNQSHNQKLSRVASKFNELATVDFSSASDTISKELVREILPLNWQVLVWAFRSNSYRLQDSTYCYEKFSSMGNAFTFELETLIFYSMALTVCELLNIKGENVSVYGDDVILPVGAFDLYHDISEDLGFVFNRAKSYSSSYYRESCGAHWWNGVDIKPIFQKEPFNGKTPLLKSANAVRRLAHRRNTFGCDQSFYSCWRLLAGALGQTCPRISDGFGDIGLIENFDHPFVKAIRAKHGVEGFYVRVWALQAVQRYVEHQGLLLFKLKQIGMSRDDRYFDGNVRDLSAVGNSIPMPMRSRHARIRVLIPRWYDLGPWL